MHRFPFLLSDETKKGKRLELPADAYYPDYSLVIEYQEEPHFTKNPYAPGNYDRRRDVLVEYGIKLIEIDIFSFYYNSKYRIMREEERDLRIIKEKLDEVLR